MSRQSVSDGGREDSAEFRQELLGRLGVRPDAGDQDIEAAHNGLVEFLELAPHDLKSWAATQTANVDEAFALLSGPEQDLGSSILLAATAQQGLPVTSPPPAPAAPAQPAAPSAPTGFAALAGNKKVRTRVAWVGVPLLVIGVVLGVYFNGKSSEVPGINGTPTGQQTQAASGGATATPVDPAKVTALMTKIAANPKDAASLQELGTLYFAAGDYKNAALWAQKVLGVDPTNKTALISIGAAQFNLGNQAEAKKNWLVAAKLYPKEAEVHYDLGFYYMSQTPPDSANMQAEWKKVVAINPNSQLAKSVQTHIKGTKTPAPTATATAK